MIGEQIRFEAVCEQLFRFNFSDDISQATKNSD